MTRSSSPSSEGPNETNLLFLPTTLCLVYMYYRSAPLLVLDEPCSLPEFSRGDVADEAPGLDLGCAEVRDHERVQENGEGCFGEAAPVELLRETGCQKSPDGVNLGPDVFEKARATRRRRTSS